MHHLGETMIVNYFLRKIEKNLRARIFSSGLEVGTSSILIFSSRLLRPPPPIHWLSMCLKEVLICKSFVLSWFHESLEEGNSLLPKKLSYFLKKPCLLVFRDSDLEKPFTCWNNKVFVQISIFEGRQISRTFWKCKKIKIVSKRRSKSALLILCVN